MGVVSILPLLWGLVVPAAAFDASVLAAEAEALLEMRQLDQAEAIVREALTQLAARGSGDDEAVAATQVQLA